jgi:hypothetical protein
MQDRQWFVLYVLVCLEVGIFLILVPWTPIWERNYFLQAYPWLETVALDPTFRGAVSGLGIANLYVLLHEVVERRRRLEPATPEFFPGGLGADRHTDKSAEQPESKKQGKEKASDEAPALVTHEKRSQNV